MTGREYNPGQPTAWDVSTGEVLPLARNALVTAGIDPDDAGAVLTHYTTGYYSVAERRPYWLHDWTLANVALENLP